jgi:hypothetical protein
MNWVLLITLHFIWTGEAYEFPSPQPVTEEECLDAKMEATDRLTQDGVEAEAYCVKVDPPAGTDI